MLETAEQISAQYKGLEKQIQEQGLSQEEFQKKFENNEIFTETKSALDKLGEQFKEQKDHLNKLDIELQEKLTPSQKAKSDLRSRIEQKMYDEDVVKQIQNSVMRNQGTAFQVASPSFEEKSSGEFEVKAPVTTANISGGTNYATGLDPQGALLTPVRMRHLRDIVPVVPITQPIVSFLRQGAITNSAAVVAEGAAKPELEAAFAEIEEKAEYVAGLMTVSKQMLTDMPLAQSIIPTILTQQILYAEDLAGLKGPGGAGELNGVYTQATAFTAAAGFWNGKVPLANSLDAMIALRSVATGEEYATNLIVINPNELGYFDVLKDSNGAYIAENWQDKLRVAVLESTVMEINELLAGDFSVNNMYIAEYESVNIEFFPQHVDNVAKNLITIRAEERVAMIVRNPLAFRKATISTLVGNLTAAG